MTNRHSRSRGQRKPPNKRVARKPQAAAEAERDERTELISRWSAIHYQDAKERVSDGELAGRSFYTSCDPLGGGSSTI
jgi:hypothetical protein